MSIWESYEHAQVEGVHCSCCGAPLRLSDFEGEFVVGEEQYVAQCETRNCYRAGARGGDLFLVLVTAELHPGDPSDGFDTIEEIGQHLARVDQNGVVQGPSALVVE